MLKDQPRVKTGQIWQEVDNRFERYILVLHVDREHATIKTCNKDGIPLSLANQSKAKLSRFHGKTHGYAFIGVI